ncbi:MAG: class I SAM-dependent methyltransferase, partial [bacterium]
MKFFEIGCGTGFVLQALERETAGLELFGSEIHLEGLRYARERLARTELFQMDAQHIPFRNEFGGIGLFDVLEHIADDQAVLRQVHQALVPGGGLVVTVPQHAFLWSRVDELSG